MEFLKKIRINMVVNGLLTLLLGVFFVINPHGAGSTIAWIAGAAILIAGIVDVIRYVTSKEYAILMSSGLFGGILKCVLGIFAFTHTGTVMSLLSYICSIFVIVSGANCLEGAMQLKRAGVPGWPVNMVLAAGITAAGAIMLFVPFGAVSTAIMVIGVLLIFDGLTELFTTARMKRISKDFARMAKDLKDEMDGNIIDM